MTDGYRVVKPNPDLHEALRVVATADVEYLSYKGQTKWNELSKKEEKK